MSLRGSARRREIQLAYLLLSHALLLLLPVLAYPVGWELWTSLTALSPISDGPQAFVGFENYRRFLGEAEFWRAAAVTVVYAAVTSVAKLALGLGFALLLARPFRGRALVFLAVFLPWAYPAGVSVIGWYWTLNPPTRTAYAPFMGHLKYLVDGVFGGGAWAFVSVTLFNIWRGSSFIGVLLLAGINAIPAELFEYALLDSKSPWQRFRAVTLPLLKPFFALGVFLSLTSAFGDLANVWKLTAGRIVFPVIGNPLIVVNPTLENFEELFERKSEVRGFVGDALRRSYPFLDWLANTLIVFTGSVVVTLAASVAAAYALGRLRPPGFRWWRYGIFATYIIPQTILFIPLYRVVNTLGLDDNLLALLLIYPSLALPFCVWMLSGYFQHLPREIEEAALLEGASRATAFFRIILPMSRPVLVAAGIFTLGTVASDFMIASVFLLTPNNQTITAGIGTFDVALDELAAVAAGNLLAIPVVTISAVFPPGYVRGLPAPLIEGA